MKKALLIIDVQNGMFQEDNAVYKGDSLLKNLKGLILSHALPRHQSSIYSIMDLLGTR